MEPEYYLEFVPEHVAAAIGTVIAQWSIMEHFIEDAIWRAARVPLNVGHSFTSQTQVLGKLDILPAFAMCRQPRHSALLRQGDNCLFNNQVA